MVLTKEISIHDLGSEKIKATVVVIGYQKEDHRMYPHLYDFLKNLRCIYAEVVYLDDDDRGDGLYSFDRFVHNIISIQGCKALVRKLRINIGSFFDKTPRLMKRERPVTDSLPATPPSFWAIAKDILGTFNKLIMYFVKRTRLIDKLKKLDMKHERRLLIAIDHTALAVATKYFEGKVILWSYDIPTKDYDSNHHMRIKNGLYEKLITSKGALSTDTVIIQDEKRKCLLEEAMNVHFKNVIYLPVSLNDSKICINSAELRRNTDSFPTVNIIQSGGVGKSRLSDILIKSYECWPANYSLTIHGMFFSHDIYEIIDKSVRKPEVSCVLFSHENLPSFLGNYDIGFIGYAEKNRNHDYIENASAQLVTFLRSGIPVIVCGSSILNDFINVNNIGIGVSSLDSIESEIEKIIKHYAFYSRHARMLFESRFNLQKIFNESIIDTFETAMTPSENDSEMYSTNE